MKYVVVSQWMRGGVDDAGEDYYEPIFKLPDGTEYNGPLFAEVEDDN